MAAHEKGPRRTLAALAGLLGLSGCIALGVLWLVPSSHRDPNRGGGFSAAQREPTLQIAPQSDLAAYRARKRAELAATGPIAGEPGYARIPIDRAMALMTQRGLRARPVEADNARRDAP